MRADAAATTAKPIIDMGRMKHEAVAIDPVTKIAYLTEDQPGHSGFYRFLPKDTSGTPGSYEAGGRLQSASVTGRRNADLRNPKVSDLHHIDWVGHRGSRPEPGRRAEHGFPRLRKEASGPSVQAWNAGALWLSKAEGISQHAGKFYVVDSEAGLDVLRRPGHGDGAVWEYDPANSTLRAIFVAGSQIVGDNIDNITVEPARRHPHVRGRRSGDRIAMAPARGSSASPARAIPTPSRRTTSASAPSNS